MDKSILSLLKEPIVRAALRQAWRDSQPGVRGGHEEGGFIVRDQGDLLDVVRWPVGSQDEIFLPPYAEGKVKDKDIIATFHTHPNTGSGYLQEPSETDKRAVRDDIHLKSTIYIGEFVVSHRLIYWINLTGDVTEIGSTAQLLDGAEGS